MSCDLLVLIVWCLICLCQVANLDLSGCLVCILPLVACFAFGYLIAKLLFCYFGLMVWCL